MGEYSVTYHYKLNIATQLTLGMATSYHMEALRRQRVIERAVAARRRMEIEFQKMQAPESVDPPSLEPASERSGSRHSQSTRSVSAKSRNSNRTLSR